MNDDLSLVRLGSSLRWDVSYGGAPLGRIEVNEKDHIPDHKGWYLSFRYMREMEEDDVMIKLAIKRVCRFTSKKLIYAEVDKGDEQRIEFLVKSGFNEVLVTPGLPTIVLVWTRP